MSKELEKMRTPEAKERVNKIEAAACAFEAKYKKSRSVVHASKDLIPILKQLADLRTYTSKDHPPECNCGMTIELIRSQHEIEKGVQFAKLQLTHDAKLILWVGEMKETAISEVPPEVLQQVIDEEGRMPDRTFVGKEPEHVVNELEKGLDHFFKKCPYIKPMDLVHNIQELVFGFRVLTDATQQGASA